MFNRIPTENWQYNFNDIFLGLVASFNNRNNDTIHIKGIGNCISIRSGRTAIVAALQVLGLKPAAKIGVPLYSCPVVFKAVKESGFTPVFIDIERKNFCISKDDLSKKISNVDAIIAIHMFGNMCDMEGLLQAAQGKPIIEDCAQSLGSKIEGRLAGTIGTVGIFSFRSGKYLSVGEGGALFSNDRNIYSELYKIVSEMKSPTKIEEVKHVFKTYLRTKLRSKPLYGLIGRRIWQIYNRTVDYSAKTPIIISKILKPDYRLTLERLNYFDGAVEIQRANAEYYLNKLRFGPEMFCVEKKGAFYNRYAFPILFPSQKDRESIAAYLYNHQIDPIKPYTDIVEIASTYYGYKGGCPITEDVEKRILLIPSHYLLKEKEIKKITEYLNRAWIKHYGNSKCIMNG